MNRSLPSFGHTARHAKSQAQGRSARAAQLLVAVFVVLLQLSGALHFTLVPHSFSAALGGVVHVHAERASEGSSARRALSHASRSSSWDADTLSCAVDLCPFADAPHGSPPNVAALTSSTVQFGASRLLREARARVPNSGRVFSSAPKTSPPA